MDAREHHEKDFLSSMFSDDRQQQSQLNNMFSMSYSQPTVQPSMPQTMSPELSMDMLNNLMSMQGIESQPTSPASPQYNPQSLLEQQFKLTQLQQLQQLQNQIFQQQIALISSQTAGVMQSSPSIEPRRGQPHQFTGLPTPGPSAEIQAQQPPIDFVSPIILNNSYMDSQESYQSNPHMSPMNNHGLNSNYAAPRGSTSAPEHIAFRTNLPPSADLDFDISPLTSPWLGAHQHQQAMSNFSSSSNKRNASSSGDEGCGMPSRKRQSPAIRPTNPSVQGSSSSKKYARGSKSTSSTPLMRSTRSRKGSTAGEIPGDTPSPVDLSMPPPAPPLLESSSSSSLSSEQMTTSSPQFNPHLMPVTPASIMKLGRLGINNNGNGMAPPTRQVVPLKAESKGKAAASSSTATARSKTGDTPRKGTRKSATSGSLVSPSLKAILPAGSYPHPLPLSSPLLLPTPGTGMAVRKTSHKAAEQKRRDSLKTTFDDLRVLLPPIPLPTDDKYPVDEILPGALPPRGPPKAGGEGPNKGVSKLQLLMCGNEYIRVLRARVERRDEEVGRLRREVRRLRLGVGVETQQGQGEGEEVDLERDLDAVEALGGGTLGMGMGSGPAPGVGTMPTLGEDEGDDDPGED